ncbi:haloacid dehalogenase type II [Rhodoferax sp. GW822-FHT02A01]|uniref:haloacid dehalogenase type II n=1 Tax=Rhodoferax sp. GW822-FHT02A01 TaxID=3141537 RepID=UPI00315DF1D6
MIKVVVFDAYGTLFDVYSIGALADRLYPGHGAAIATIWRDKQIEYTRLIAMSDPHGTGGSRFYQSFWNITRAALRYALERLALPQSEAQEEALMGQYAKLEAFPENLDVLQRLKAQSFATAILSNGSEGMLDKAVQSAGMADALDKIISVDSVRTFKTMPTSYGLVGKAFEVQPHEVLFVSSNAWDALGATWFGFKTLWVNRQNLPFEAIGPRPHFAGADLNAVFAALA